jgi:hypothetical protein
MISLHPAFPCPKIPLRPRRFSSTRSLAVFHVIYSTWRTTPKRTSTWPSRRLGVPLRPPLTYFRSTKPPGSRFLRMEGVLVLKVPVGSDTYVRSQLVYKVEELRTRKQVLGDFQDTQAALLILVWTAAQLPISKPDCPGLRLISAKNIIPAGHLASLNAARSVLSKLLPASLLQALSLPLMSIQRSMTSALVATPLHPLLANFAARCVTSSSPWLAM